MKTLAAAVLMIALVGCKHAQPLPKSAATQFTNCYFDGSSGNTGGFQNTSQIYQCDQGRFELNGKWSMTVEYGTMYRSELGKLETKTEAATQFDRDAYKWCRVGNLEVTLCGATGAFKAELSMLPWYPNPADYPEISKGYFPGGRP